MLIEIRRQVKGMVVEVQPWKAGKNSQQDVKRLALAGTWLTAPRVATCMSVATDGAVKVARGESGRAWFGALLSWSRPIC